MSRRSAAASEPAAPCDDTGPEMRAQFELLSQMIEDIAGELALEPLLNRIV